MKLKLVPEAWTVLVHAWSSRLMVICVLLQLLEQPIVDVIQQWITGYSWWTREIVQVLIAAVGVLAARHLSIKTSTKDHSRQSQAADMDAPS